MKKKTLYVDLGGISYFPNEKLSGIPRVTLSLAKEISTRGAYRGVELNLLSLLNDGYSVPKDFLNKHSLPDIDNNISSSKGFIFMLDIYYFKFNFLNKLPEEIRNNFTVIDYIHDILPISRKGLFQVSEFKFKYLVHQSFQFSDAIITPSKGTIDDITSYITSTDEVILDKPLKLGFNYHGADFSNKPLVQAATCLREILSKPYFLMVGSVEIRKNHLFVLNVFEKLWAQGVDVTLCIAGRIGWKVEPFIAKLQDHPERDKRLFFINYPSDEELAQLYTDSNCLIFASSDEGFGLPIVEAAHFGSPLLLSDIAIFHEIAGDHARYFSLEHESYLVEAIKSFLEDDRAGVRQEDSSKIKQISWSQSAKNLLDSIIDDRWYCTIHPDKFIEYHVQNSESDPVSLSAGGKMP